MFSNHDSSVYFTVWIERKLDTNRLVRCLFEFPPRLIVSQKYVILHRLSIWYDEATMVQINSRLSKVWVKIRTLNLIAKSNVMDVYIWSYLPSYKGTV